MNTHEYNIEIDRINKVIADVKANCKVGRNRLSPQAGTYIKELEVTIWRLERQRDGKYSPRKVNAYGFSHDYAWGE